MFTIDRLAKIDSIAMRILATLDRGLAWVDYQFEAILVDAAYKVAEAKAAAIGKAEAKISDLEDARAELEAYRVEARDIIQRKYRAALDALAAELATKGDKLDTDLAAAAEALIAADKAYEATIKAASEKLGVEVDA